MKQRVSTGLMFKRVEVLNICIVFFRIELQFERFNTGLMEKQDGFHMIHG